MAEIECINADPVALGIMVPCYNEERNISGALRNVATAMQELGVTYQVLVVDDRSTDRTVERVRGFVKGTSYPIRCLSNRANEGLGYNYFLGASLINSEYYMMINGDNVEPVHDIKAIVGMMGKADVVIPYWKNPRRRGLPRYLISITYTRLVNLLSGNQIRYYNAPVLHRRANVTAFYVQFKTRGFGYQAEIICHLLLNGHTHEEVAIEGDLCSNKNTSAFRPKNIWAVSMSLLAIAKRRFFQRYTFVLDPSRFTFHDFS